MKMKKVLFAFNASWILLTSLTPTFASDATIFRVQNPRNNPFFVLDAAHKKVFSIPTDSTFSFIHSGESRSFAYASGKSGTLKYNFQESFDALATTCLREKIEKEHNDDHRLFTCDLRLDEDKANTGFFGAAYKMTVIGLQSFDIPRSSYGRFYDQFKPGFPKMTVEETTNTLRQVSRVSQKTAALTQWERDLKIVSKIERADRPSQQNFLVFGDQGHLGDPKEPAKPGSELTAQSMYSTCILTGCDFGIGVGDNIYKSGPKITDKNWEEEFTQKFVHPFFSLWSQFQIPFFMTLGNHDVGIEDFWQGDWTFAWQEAHKKPHYDAERRPRMDAQIQFTLSGANPKTNNKNLMWNLPAENYSQTIEKNGVKTFLVVIDTNYYPGQLAGHDTPYNEDQAEWLQTVLHSAEAREADWRIVVGHHPIVSVGRHGVNVGKYIGKNDVESMSQLRKQLHPVLCQAGVDLYLVGHDHHLEIDSIPCRENRSVIQILSGAASKADIGKWHEKGILGGNAFSPELVERSKTFLWANRLTREAIVQQNKPVEPIMGFSLLKLSKTVADIQMIQATDTGPHLLECWSADRTHPSLEASKFLKQGCEPHQINWTPIFTPTAVVSN